MRTRTTSRASVLAAPVVAALSLLACLASGPAFADGETQPAPPGPPASSPPAAPSAALPPVQDVVNQVQAFYNQTSTFSSDFEQTFLVKAYNTTKRSNGHVVFQKPGKMDWTYTDPKDNRVVSDGTTLRVYEAANNQVYEQPVGASQYPAALSFLTGQGQLSTSFNFELRDGAGQLGFPGGYVLIGTPQTPTPAIQKVLFYVDKGTMQILRLLIVDGQSNKNMFTFTGSPKVNLPVNPNQFVFVPPPNATVIRP